jgi:hypothetical protein
MGRRLGGFLCMIAERCRFVVFSVCLQMLPPLGRVTYPITTFKLSCSRFYRSSCIHSAEVEKAEKEIA